MKAESEAFRSIRGVFVGKHVHKTINPYADRIRFNHAIENLEPRLKRTLDEVRKHVAAINSLTPSNAVEEGSK